MFWIIDVIILAILALCVFLGYKRGLAKCVIKIISFFVALAVAFVFFRPVGNFIKDNTQIDDGIRSSITKIIESDVEEEGQVNEDSKLPSSMIDHINNEIKTSVNQTTETVVTSVADEVANTAVNVIAWLGIFIVVRIILLIVTLVFSLLTELPVLKQMDKTGGVIYGVLEAAVIVFVIFGIISFISPMIESSGLIDMINKSIIGSLLYNHNIIMNFLF